MGREGRLPWLVFRIGNYDWLAKSALGEAPYQCIEPEEERCCRGGRCGLNLMGLPLFQNASSTRPDLLLSSNKILAPRELTAPINQRVASVEPVNQRQK